ncbi:MAG: metal-dependent transcriptional regulator, partial [Flavobacteriaceae bacterium]|nr:metal-dependent transcriptional regulator [Flavobacteriaceae bacterium]
MLSLSEENYLKAIYHLEWEHPDGVSTNAIAEKMDTKASSVTDMLKKLSDKKLVKYKKYQGVKLSTAGNIKALKVIRKHRLWEVFLLEKLQFGWEEVHAIAEQLEHIQSDKLTDRLEAFLDYPKRDPHGDPIPDAEGKYRVSNTLLLSQLTAGQQAILVGVKDSSAEFLYFLDKHSIRLGETLSIEEIEEFDQSYLLSFPHKS